LDPLVTVFLLLPVNCDVSGLWGCLLEQLQSRIQVVTVTITLVL
jgi:hypothetical protein